MHDIAKCDEVTIMHVGKRDRIRTNYTLSCLSCSFCFEMYKGFESYQSLSSNLTTNVLHFSPTEMNFKARKCGNGTLPSMGFRDIGDLPEWFLIEML